MDSILLPARSTDDGGHRDAGLRSALQSVRLGLDWAAIRSILFEGIVDAVLVVIVHVVMDQPAEMFFIQRDDMVEDLAAATSHPAFGDTVLPGCLRTRLLGRQTRRIQERDKIRIELRVAIQDEIAVRPASGKASRNCCTTHSAVG